MVSIPMLVAIAWLRTAASPTPAPQAPDRMALFAADDAAYRTLAIPRTYKTAPDAPTHLLAFRGGLCVRDLGLADSKKSTGDGGDGKTIMQESGTLERGFVAADGNAAAVIITRYVSRVDLTPGQTSTSGDTVTGDTTLTLVDPEHPDGRWRVTFENSRWVKDVLVLPGRSGVAVTTFLPRNGPTDIRVLDAAGREEIRVPESAAEALRVESSPEAGYLAAELAFRENEHQPERGVMVFDIARGTHWTYTWRYGSDDEPVSWTLQSHGVLSVKLASGTRRFDASGGKL